jgi:lysophospholipase L1-like esterase
LLSGAGVRRVVDELEGLDVREEAVCLIVGGNDCHKHKSEKLIGRFKEAIEKIRMKGGTPIVCGILPRVDHGREWSSRAIGCNDRIERYCRDKGLAFVGVWDRFYGRRDLFARDGIHLSGAGVSVLARMLDRTVSPMGF